MDAPSGRTQVITSALLTAAAIVEQGGQMARAHAEMRRLERHPLRQRCRAAYELPAHHDRLLLAGSGY